MAKLNGIMAGHRIKKTWYRSFFIKLGNDCGDVIRMYYTPRRNVYTYRMWLLFAGLAAMFWGMSYAISEQVYRHVSIYTTLAIDTLIISVLFFAAAAYKGLLKPDIAGIMGSSKVFWLVAAGIFIV